jgi:FkbM family methyltransferase
MKNKKCDLYLMGLGEKEEILSLWNSSPHNCGGYSIHYYKDNIYESKKIYDSVKIRTLDSYHFNNISMIKIDVESNELQVLKGAIETIKKYRPIIFIENAGHAFDHVELSQFDIFFKNINYTKKESNIKKSYIDLWIPE